MMIINYFEKKAIIKKTFTAFIFYNNQAYTQNK